MRYLCILGLLAMASSAFAVPPGVLFWDQSPIDEENGLACQRIGAVGVADVADDFRTTQDWIVTGATWQTVDGAGYAWDGTDDFIIYEYTASGPGAPVVELWNVPNTREYLGVLFSRDWYEYEIVLSDEDQFFLPAGDYYVLLRPFTPGTLDQSFWLTAPGNGQESYFRSAYFGFPDWVTATTVFGSPYEVNFKLYAIPEPGVISLAGLLLGAGAIWLRRK